MPGSEPCILVNLYSGETSCWIKWLQMKIVSSKIYCITIISRENYWWRKLMRVKIVAAKIILLTLLRRRNFFPEKIIAGKNESGPKYFASEYYFRLTFEREHYWLRKLLQARMITAVENYCRWTLLLWTILVLKIDSVENYCCLKLLALKINACWKLLQLKIIAEEMKSH